MKLPELRADHTVDRAGVFAGDERRRMLESSDCAPAPPAEPSKAAAREKRNVRCRIIMGQPRSQAFQTVPALFAVAGRVSTKLSTMANRFCSPCSLPWFWHAPGVEFGGASGAGASDDTYGRPQLADPLRSRFSASHESQRCRASNVRVFDSHCVVRLETEVTCHPNVE